jgi:hypothetical protein
MALYQIKHIFVTNPINDGFLASQLTSIWGMINFIVVAGSNVTIKLHGHNFSTC